MVKQRMVPKTRSTVNPGPKPTVARVTIRVAPFTIGFGGTATPSYGTVTAALGNTTKASNYQAIYDEYRITRVRVRFVNLYNDSLVSTGYANISGAFAACIDWDDAVTPTGYVDILNHQNVKSGNTLRSYTFDFQPKALFGAETTSIVPGAPVKSPWLDTAQGTILHYGVKWMLDPLSNTVTGNTDLYTVWSEYDIEFRNPT